ncbi:NYN domain-containing protein [Suttonella sp. R2A3]|uniref:NYN domain-containing protein n=1 Tax=Suttonella sp. R2A3 TaxID=2908648 RepID=UPI001F338156|nr:NYN domain-containing protein [Suttonella sp. R2A3]UJF23892.1 NYN domain-containing protein [Suttonella sp. R2A3]
MKTAVLIDGGFFLKRYQKLNKGWIEHTPQQVAKNIYHHALKDVEKLNQLARNNGFHKRELYRIFFYDCPPETKKICHPLTGEQIDLKISKTAVFRSQLHIELKKKRKLALRLGKIASYGEWQLGEKQLKKLLSKKMTIEQLEARDIKYKMTQKGVDMRLGLDISSLAYEGHIDQIVLIAGDSDFVPAAKMARRAGIDFILDPMWHEISSDLHEHIDGIVSAAINPQLKHD